MQVRNRLIGAGRRIGAVLTLAGVLLLAAAWLGCVPLRRTIARLAWRLMLAGFGIELRVIGVPCPGMLLVANHVSWVDIPALALACNTRACNTGACNTGTGFVAKAEVGRWPVIGPLARRFGCVFVERERKLDARSQALDLRGRLADGCGLVLFPEGTTSMGRTVLPFRSSLFAAAGIAAAGQVQPVALRYANRDGSPHDPRARRAVAWLDDDALLPHALGLAARGGTRLEIVFGDPVAAVCRKDLAGLARARIAELLAGDQAATLKRAA